MPAQVGAVVVEYRSPRLTIDCVRELLIQGVACVMVVDNSDDSGASLSALLDEFAANASVVIDSPGENIGFAAGVNRGFARLAVRGDFRRIVMINNDAVAGPGLIAALASEFESHPDALVAFPAIAHAGQMLREIYYHRWLAMVHHRPVPGTFRVPRGCCMMVATDRFRDKIFDETFFIYGEEIELGWRLRHRPGALRFVPDVVVDHVGSASTSLGSAFYEERTAAAHLLLSAFLAGHGPTAWAVTCTRLASITARSLVRALRAQSIVPIRALYSGSKIAAAAKACRQLSEERPPY